MWYNSASSATLKSRKLDILRRALPTARPMTNSLRLDDIPRNDLFLNLADKTALIHGFSDEQALLDYALDCLLSLTQATAGSLFIWDDAAKELVLKCAKGPYLNQVTGSRLKLGEGVSGKVADQGHSVLVKNIQEDARFISVKRFGQYQTGSFISLPVLASNKLLGVINITEKQTLQPFTEDDFDRVNAIVKHVAIAYTNLKTTRRLWKENEQLSETVMNLRNVVKEQEAFVSLGKLAANLAHELNNPLDGIRRFVNLSLNHLGDDTPAKEYLLKAKGGIRRAIQVIRGLLNFTNQSVRQPIKPAELHQIIREVLASVQQSPSFVNIRFTSNLFPGDVFVKDTGMTAVLHNLFQNSRHAMNERGEISLQTEILDKWVVLKISDNGPGIPQAIRSRIFEPFFSTKEAGQGTGIGLSICRDVVERAGGDLGFESEEGKGTTFIIKIPFQSFAEAVL